jgi:hypothetical protein
MPFSSRTRQFLLPVLAAFAWSAASHAEPQSSSASCQTEAVAAPCAKARQSLRELRLQNAVQNGDISPAEARVLLEQEESQPVWHAHAASSEPAASHRPSCSHHVWHGKCPHPVPPLPSPSAGASAHP